MSFSANLPLRLPFVAKTKTPAGRLSAEGYDRLLGDFASPIAAFDCGRFCAPLNKGEPVCCTTENAVPVLDKAEWQVLVGRTDLWRKFKPHDAAGRAIVKEASPHCVAAECKGAAFCERDNRSLSCRAFPFAPYINSDGDFVGASYYWGFADRCWVISHLYVATPEYLREFFLAYDRLLLTDRDEWQAHRDNSSAMRRVFSRRDEKFAWIGRDLIWRWEQPHQGGAIAMQDPEREIRAFAPYTSPQAYRAAVAAEGGVASDGLVGEVFSLVSSKAKAKTKPKAKSKTKTKTKSRTKTKPKQAATKTARIKAAHPNEPRAKKAPVQNSFTKKSSGKQARAKISTATRHAQ